MKKWSRKTYTYIFLMMILSSTIFASIFYYSYIDINVLTTNTNINIEFDLEIECDYTIERLFNNSIATLHTLKSHNYIEAMHCPSISKIGWRAPGYTPFIHGNDCEPWWARDAVYILSHILNKNMNAIEYSSGASTLWLSLHVKHLISMESSRIWFNRIVNITNITNITNNYLIASMQKYVNIKLDNNNSYHNIDVVSVDGIKRRKCMNYTIEKLIKPHGGIVILDNSDREGNNGINASKIVPKHWLRYDSMVLQQHIDMLPTERWLKNARTTVWITRDKNCL
eukprot:243707_1